MNTASNPTIATIFEDSDIEYSKIDNKYGINTNIFKVFKGGESLFVKIMDSDSAKRSVENYELLAKFLPTPKLIKYRTLNGKTALVYEYIENKLMTDLVLNCKNKSDLNRVLFLEEKKNILLTKMYSKTQTTLDKDSYINSNTNLLYMKRLLGKRYQEYFETSENISNLFDKNIFINNQKTDITAIKIIGNIKNKLLHLPNKTIDSYLIHGDAHHQNILVTDNDNIDFIDLDYSGYSTISMELAKPYYIDLIGTLFFFFEEKLFDYFDLIDFSTDDKSLYVNIKLTNSLRERLLLTDLKVNAHRDFVINSRDYLTLNEYLVICHLTSRNPNNYERRTQILFILFIFAISTFDPFKPESLFDIFK